MSQEPFKGFISGLHHCGTLLKTGKQKIGPLEIQKGAERVSSPNYLRPINKRIQGIESQAYSSTLEVSLTSCAPKYSGIYLGYYCILLLRVGQEINSTGIKGFIIADRFLFTRSSCRIIENYLQTGKKTHFKEICGVVYGWIISFLKDHTKCLLPFLTFQNIFLMKKQLGSRTP